MKSDTAYQAKLPIDIPYKFVNQNRKMVLKLYGHSFDLEELALDFGTPLDVTFPNVIISRIDSIFSNFEAAVNKKGVNMQLSYFYPMKVNPRKELMSEIINCSKKSVGIEIGDIFELKLLLNNFPSEIKHKKLIFHGPKSKDYLEQIISLNERGFDVVFVLEDPSELKTLKSIYKKRIKFGIRLNTGGKDRFGMSLDDAVHIASLIKTDLALLHLHFGEPASFDKLSKGISLLQVILKNFDEGLINDLLVDVGGGMAFYDQARDARHDSQEYFECIIDAIERLNMNSRGRITHLALEAGRWVAAPTQLTIFKLIEVKRLNGKYRYVMDGSFITDLPDTWGINKKWSMFPINMLGAKNVKTYIDGVTCDSDDMYTKNEPELKYLPKPDSDKNLFICIAYTGAYQDTLGNHHCAIPDAKKILIDKTGKVKRINMQRFEDMQRSFGYND